METHANLPPTTALAYIGLGSNLGEPLQQLQRAVAALAGLPQSRLLDVSSFYQTEPVGIIEQPRFINAVAALTTALSPHDLLAQLLRIEAGQGRVRAQKNGPRTLDLDILQIDQLCINDQHLSIPHPRLHERGFVLVPLLEIAPDITLPGLGPARSYLTSAMQADVHKMTGPGLSPKFPSELAHNPKAESRMNTDNP